MKNTRLPLAIDVFAGCGGLTTGLKMAGFSVVAAIEIDEKARHTYALNHPEALLVGRDVRHVTGQHLMSEIGIARGDLDLLAGCPPCQGFSTIRRRNKMRAAKDARNDLIDDFSRLAIELQPKLIMMENVPGLEQYEKFEVFLKLLEKHGYQVTYGVVNVADFGVAQRRRRLILLASILGKPQLSKPTSGVVTVQEAIGRLPQAGQSGDPVHDLPEMRSERIKALIRHIPKDGGSRHSLPESMQLACHKKSDGFNDVYGRMKWNDLAPTITGGCTNPSKGRFLHPAEDRAITLREAAILQGFPTDYKFDVSHGKEALSLMIGNALPPPFIRDHAQSLSQLL